MMSVAGCASVGGVEDRSEFGGGAEVVGGVGDGGCFGVDGVVEKLSVGIIFSTSGCKSNGLSVSSESRRLSMS